MLLFFDKKCFTVLREYEETNENQNINATYINDKNVLTFVPEKSGPRLN